MIILLYGIIVSECLEYTWEAKNLKDQKKADEDCKLLKNGYNY